MPTGSEGTANTDDGCEPRVDPETQAKIDALRERCDSIMSKAADAQRLNQLKDQLRMMSSFVAAGVIQRNDISSSDVVAQIALDVACQIVEHVNTVQVDANGHISFTSVVSPVTTEIPLGLGEDAPATPSEGSPS